MQQRRIQANRRADKHDRERRASPSANRASVHATRNGPQQQPCERAVARIVAAEVERFPRELQRAVDGGRGREGRIDAGGQSAAPPSSAVPKNRGAVCAHRQSGRRVST